MMDLDIVVMSISEMANTSDTSLIIITNSLHSGGIIRRMDWGMMIVAHGLPVGHAKRLGGFALPLVDGLDGRAHYLGAVGGGIQGKRDQRRQKRALVHGSPVSPDGKQGRATKTRR